MLEYSGKDAPIDTNTFNDLVAQILKLSPSEQLRMISLLATSLQGEFIDKTDWHARLRATYGILADDPLEEYPTGDGLE